MEEQKEEKTLALRRGKPTKYTKETPRRVLNYTNNCQKKNDIPTIEQLAFQLGVGVRTLYAWEEAHSDFQHTMDMLRSAQRDLLIRGGLTNKYNSRFASFLLKANHGMQDRQPLVHATQNNTFAGISPELMAEAIKITREKDPTFMMETSIGNTQTEE